MELDNKNIKKNKSILFKYIQFYLSILNGSQKVKIKTNIFNMHNMKKWFDTFLIHALNINIKIQ